MNETLNYIDWRLNQTQTKHNTIIRGGKKKYVLKVKNFAKDKVYLFQFPVDRDEPFPALPETGNVSSTHQPALRSGEGSVDRFIFIFIHISFLLLWYQPHIEGGSFGNLTKAQVAVHRIKRPSHNRFWIDHQPPEGSVAPMNILFLLLTR